MLLLGTTATNALDAMHLVLYTALLAHLEHKANIMVYNNNNNVVLYSAGISRKLRSERY